MNGASIELFADRSDLDLLFDVLNSIDKLKYIEALSAINKEPITFEDAKSLTNYQVDYENPTPRHVFLCLNRSQKVDSRKLTITGGNGAYKLKTDEVFNPTAISILLGGEAGPNTIVQTVISSAYYCDEAKLTLHSIRKLINKVSTKVKSFRVMPSAYEKLLKGHRLAQGIEFNRNYDLKID